MNYHEQYLSCGPQIGIREWHRRKDRSAVETWPAPQLPPHWIETQADSGERLSYAVDLKVAPRLIGRITLRDIDRGEARLGIYLHPQEIGKGFGREALAIFCSYIFRRVGLARLRLDVASDNRRAVACYRAVGFRTVDFIRRDEHAYLEMEHTSAVRVHTAC